MILYQTAIWMEERRKLSAAIAAVQGDCAFLRKKKRQCDEELLLSVQLWLAPASGRERISAAEATADVL